jgi:nucleolysin TIA-1/TIAR
VYDAEMKINWAYAGGVPREDTTSHFHVFIGDLSTEVDDRALWEAFSPFGSISDARVMWDQYSGRSRGYGFVSFRTREDAEHAIRDMNGEWLGSRAIRVNWANQRSMQQQQARPGSNLDYEAVFNAAPPTNLTVYVGNVASDASDEQIRAVFSEYGFLDDLRIQRDKGYCFVRYQSHDQATRAIMGCNGRLLGSKAIKCSWGKEKTQQTVDPYANYYGQASYSQYPASYAYPQYYGNYSASQPAAAYGYGAAYAQTPVYGQAPYQAQPSATQPAQSTQSHQGSHP